SRRSAIPTVTLRCCNGRPPGRVRASRYSSTTTTQFENLPMIAPRPSGNSTRHSMRPMQRAGCRRYEKRLATHLSFRVKGGGRRFGQLAYYRPIYSGGSVYYEVVANPAWPLLRVFGAQTCDRLPPHFCRRLIDRRFTAPLQSR